MRELNNQWSEGWRRIVLKISVFVWFVKNNSEHGTQDNLWMMGYLPKTQDMVYSKFPLH